MSIVISMINHAPIVELQNNRFVNVLVVMPRTVQMHQFALVFSNTCMKCVCVYSVYSLISQALSAKSPSTHGAKWWNIKIDLYGNSRRKLPTFHICKTTELSGNSAGLPYLPDSSQFCLILPDSYRICLILHN